MHTLQKIGNYKNLFLIFTLLLVLGLTSRFLTHTAIYPANFSAIGAIAIFSGFFFSKQWKFILPITIMLISDLFIGFYQPGIMLAVYSCILINIFLGYLINEKKIIGKAAIFSIIGSIIFFAATNFSVWLFGNWYSHTFSGLLNCFAMAIPFFRNSLLGDLFFSIALFSSYEFALNYSKTKLRLVKNA